MNGSGRQWRSLEEWAAPDAPDSQPLPWDISFGRREMLRLMAASLALAGTSGCSRPAKEIVPFVRMPERMVPGRPVYYATALTVGGYAQGVLVKSHMGRPTKVEGNPLHPASLGATDIFGQAAVLGLYDPDRSRAILDGGRESTWQSFRAVIDERRGLWASRHGEGLRVLTESFTSPTLAFQLQRLLEAYPRAQWHLHDPLSRDMVRAGSLLAFGEDVNTIYRLDRARVVLSMDGDFLSSLPGHLRYARDFMSLRTNRRAQPAAMNRLYAMESTPTLTGALADHRQPLRAADIESAARLLASRLGLAVPLPSGDGELPRRWLDTVLEDLKQHPGECVIVPGDHQSPSVHALVQAMNQRLGNFGRTVVHTAPVGPEPDGLAQPLARLVEDMDAGAVDTLLILGGNPVFDAPGDAGFAEALGRVPLSVHLGLYPDETANRCRWHLPALHELESWGDARAFDGTASLLQPLIVPLHGGISPLALLAMITDGKERSDRDIVRSYWESHHAAPGFEDFWNRSLKEGVAAGTAAQERPMRVSGAVGANLPASAAEDSLEIQFRPDPTLRDGRHANNAWLQELPKPLTQLTWANPALLSPATAARLGLASGDMAELRFRGRSLEMPVWIMPGHADGSVTLHLGHGRQRAGRVGNGIGVNVQPLRPGDAPWFAFGASLGRTGEKRIELPSTQSHHGMDGHGLVRSLRPDQFATLTPSESPAESLYPERSRKGYAWGMVIDQSACIGCNACVIACQAENNIPVVGPKEVLRGREMHWLRIDRYHAGDPRNPKVFFQPVPCMQCELAPCEPVCPVHASVHDSEGINDQVYNRCVGTRTCQSNCPYKVRRFNFFEYTARAATHEDSLAPLRNPDVTVRSRGVMEKCTYCIQRISAARITAEMEDRSIRDGEVVTACQAACPTRAITFGDLNDPESGVSRLRTLPDHHALLAELNTRPRTTYLARLTNPNPEIEDD